MTVVCTRCGALYVGDCKCLPYLTRTPLPNQFADIPKPERKAVQIAAVPCGNDGRRYYNRTSVYALCNDGTIWIIETTNVSWWQLPPIPQDGDK